MDDRSEINPYESPRAPPEEEDAAGVAELAAIAIDDATVLAHWPWIVVLTEETLISQMYTRRYAFKFHLKTMRQGGEWRNLFGPGKIEMRWKALHHVVWSEGAWMLKLYGKYWYSTGYQWISTPPDLCAAILAWIQVRQPGQYERQMRRARFYEMSVDWSVIPLVATLISAIWLFMLLTVYHVESHLGTSPIAAGAALVIGSVVSIACVVRAYHRRPNCHVLRRVE